MGSRSAIWERSSRSTNRTASRLNSSRLRDALARCLRSGLATSATLPTPILSRSGSSHAPRNKAAGYFPGVAGTSKRLPHVPQQVTEVRPPRLAGGHDQQLGDLQLQRVREEEDQHLADEGRVQRNVVVCADAEAQALLLPP